MNTSRGVAVLAVVACVVTGSCGSSSGSDAGKVPPTSKPTITTPPVTQPRSTTSDPSAEPAELPAGWPDELALPEGVFLTDASTTAGTMSVTASVTSNPRAVYEALRAQLQGAGYTVDASAFTDTDEGGFGTISAENDRFMVTAYVGSERTGEQGWVLTVNVA